MSDRAQRHAELHRAAIHHLSGGTIFQGTGGGLKIVKLLGGGLEEEDVQMPEEETMTLTEDVDAKHEPQTNMERQQHMLEKLKSIANRPEL